MADPERSIRTRQTVRILVWVVIAAALVIFAAINTQQVSVDWLFGDGDVALWILIAGCAAVGFLAGYLTKARRT